MSKYSLIYKTLVLLRKSLALQDSDVLKDLKERLANTIKDTLEDGGVRMTQSFTQCDTFLS